MIVDEPTPCLDRGDLFDSTVPTAHMIAARLCRTCKAFAQCEVERDKVLADDAMRTQAQGTWAGLLLDPDAKSRARTRRKYAAPCGTVAGYRRHLADPTEPCEPCKGAAANERAEQRAKKNKEAAA